MKQLPIPANHRLSQTTGTRFGVRSSAIKYEWWDVYGLISKVTVAMCPSRDIATMVSDCLERIAEWDGQADGTCEHLDHDDIRKACEEIQAGWTKEDRRKRSQSNSDPVEVSLVPRDSLERRR